MQLLVGGFQIPNLDMPGAMTEHTVTNWQAGMAGAYEGLVYAPTMLEVGVVLGVLGLACLLLFAGLKFLPLRPAEDEGCAVGCISVAHGATAASAPWFR